MIVPIRNLTMDEIQKKHNLSNHQRDRVEWLKNEASIIVPNLKKTDGSPITVAGLRARVIVLFLASTFKKEVIYNSKENKVNKIINGQSNKQEFNTQDVVNTINNIICATFNALNGKYEKWQENFFTLAIHKLCVEGLNLSENLQTKKTLCAIEGLKEDQLRDDSKILEKLSRLAVKTDVDELLKKYNQLLSGTQRAVESKPVQTKSLVELLQNQEFFEYFEAIPSSE